MHEFIYFDEHPDEDPFKDHMGPHFILKCKYCHTVIAQCRCAEPKREQWGTCDACKDETKRSEGIARFASGLQLDDEDTQ